MNSNNTFVSDSGSAALPNAGHFQHGQILLDGQPLAYDPNFANYQGVPGSQGTNDYLVATVNGESQPPDALTVLEYLGWGPVATQHLLSQLEPQHDPIEAFTVSLNRVWHTPSGDQRKNKDEDWQELMRAMGLTEEFQDGILDAEFAYERHTRGCKEWVLQTMSDRYSFLIRTDRERQAEAAQTVAGPGSPSAEMALLESLDMGEADRPTAYFQVLSLSRAVAYAENRTVILDADHRGVSRCTLFHQAAVARRFAGYASRRSPGVPFALMVHSLAVPPALQPWHQAMDLRSDAGRWHGQVRQRYPDRHRHPDPQAEDLAAQLRRDPPEALVEPIYTAGGGEDPARDDGGAWIDICRRPGGPLAGALLYRCGRPDASGRTRVAPAAQTTFAARALHLILHGAQPTGFYALFDGAYPSYPRPAELRRGGGGSGHRKRKHAQMEDGPAATGQRQLFGSAQSRAAPAAAQPSWWQPGPALFAYGPQQAGAMTGFPPPPLQPPPRPPWETGLGADFARASTAPQPVQWPLTESPWDDVFTAPEAGVPGIDALPDLAMQGTVWADTNWLASNGNHAAGAFASQPWHAQPVPLDTAPAPSLFPFSETVPSDTFPQFGGGFPPALPDPVQLLAPDAELPVDPALQDNPAAAPAANADPGINPSISTSISPLIDAGGGTSTNELEQFVGTDDTADTVDAELSAGPAGAQVDEVGNAAETDIDGLHLLALWIENNRD